MVATLDCCLRIKFQCFLCKIWFRFEVAPSTFTSPEDWWSANSAWLLTHESITLFSALNEQHKWITHQMALIYSSESFFGAGSFSKQFQLRNDLLRILDASGEYFFQKKWCIHFGRFSRSSLMHGMFHWFWIQVSWGERIKNAATFDEQNISIKIDAHLNTNNFLAAFIPQLLAIRMKWRLSLECLWKLLSCFSWSSWLHVDAASRSTILPQIKLSISWKHRHQKCIDDCFCSTPIIFDYRVEYSFAMDFPGASNQILNFWLQPLMSHSLIHSCAAFHVTKFSSSFAFICTIEPLMIWNKYSKLVRTLSRLKKSERKKQSALEKIVASMQADD